MENFIFVKNMEQYGRYIFFKQKDLQTVFLYMHLNVEIRVFQYLYQSLVLECWKTVNFFPLAFLAIYLLKKSPSLLKVIAI